MTAKRKKQRKIIMQEVDETPLPRDFNKWLDNTVWKDNYKMFYKTIAPRKYLGACQNCKSVNIPLTEAKSGKIGTCPICNKTITFRNEKFSKTIHEQDFVTFVHKMKDGGFIVRNFKTIRYTDYLDFKFACCEMERCYIDKDFSEKRWFQQRTRYDTIRRAYKEVWVNGFYKQMWYSLPAQMWLYSKNLKREFKETALKYSCLDKYAKVMPVDTPNFIFQAASYPFYEYFIKLKLFNILTSIVRDDYSYMSYSYTLNKNSNNMKEILKLSDVYYKYAITHNPTLKTLSALQCLQKMKLRITKSNIQFMREWERKIHNNKLHTFNYISFDNLVKYCKSQKPADIEFFLGDYEDYIKACEGLKYNLEDTMYLKPKNFKLMHDNTLKLWEETKNKNKDKLVKKQLKKIKDLEFNSQELALIAPKSSKDITSEGKELKHCVGTYIDRVLEGTSIIMFVRKKQELNKSFYTLELNPKTMDLVQCRGLRNIKPTKEVQKFLNVWLDKIITPKRKVIAS